MRKKTKSIIAIGLVCAMLSGMLSGCGKQAEPVMNQQGGDTETNVVTDKSTPLESKDIDSTSPDGAETSTTASVTKETPKTETPEINVPVEESTSIPTQAEPVVEENTKYTPEEAIAVWKAILDENGLIYDPSIKEFASWGTGIMYLGKGYAEQSAQDDLEGMAYGDGVGTSYKHYYFEVTGSDENYVYTKAWACE